MANISNNLQYVNSAHTVYSPQKELNEKEFNTQIDTRVKNKEDISLTPKELYLKVEELVIRLGTFENNHPKLKKHIICKYNEDQNCCRKDCRFGHRVTILIAKNFDKLQDSQYFRKEQTGVEGTFRVDHWKQEITYTTPDEEEQQLKQTAENCVNFVYSEDKNQ